MMPLSGSVGFAPRSGSTLGSGSFGLRPRLRFPVAFSSMSRAAIFSCWRAAAAAARFASFSRHAFSRTRRSPRRFRFAGSAGPLLSAPNWRSSRASVEDRGAGHGGEGDREAQAGAQAERTRPDPDSGIMKTRRGWVQGYNAQAVVRPDQIILAADVTTEANDVRQLTGMLNQAQANVEAVMGEDAVLGAAVADAGYWSEANAESQTEECELFIATQKDRKQRAALREAPAPRGRMPRSMTARERMDRKLRTKRGRTLYRQRGAAVEPVFGQMKDRQGADRFSMRGLECCRSEWQLDAAVHNLRKLHRESVHRAKNQGNGEAKARKMA